MNLKGLRIIGGRDKVENPPLNALITLDGDVDSRGWGRRYEDNKQLPFFSTLTNSLHLVTPSPSSSRLSKLPSPLKTPFTSSNSLHLVTPSLLLVSPNSLHLVTPSLHLSKLPSSCLPFPSSRLSLPFSSSLPSLLLVSPFPSPRLSKPPSSCHPFPSPRLSLPFFSPSLPSLLLLAIRPVPLRHNSV
ncbi:hypothetical protein Pcinc_041683 [Petrolisthes cinctipes]|uniref:Uncharacterized protein n=1 Tax=Petrolisthes cinctipes TaxID=88211 RepID=A0AAE1EGP0_PETCI|nr:hypothetical protein Pcinc_041683 [Petrolisthes cinctipes]